MEETWEYHEDSFHGLFMWFWSCIFGLCFLWWKILKRILFGDSKYNKLQEERIRLKGAKTFAEWQRIALKIDLMDEEKQLWRLKPESHLYNYKLIQRSLQSLRSKTVNSDIHHLTSFLREVMSRNWGRMNEIELFDYCLVGTKKLIEDYVEEMRAKLEYIFTTEFDDFPHQKKFMLFYELRKLYGCSALILSGGATMGMYHLGVVKALHERKLLPKVISGTSAGSMVAALICTHDELELPKIFLPPYANLPFHETGVFWKKILHFLRKGVLMDVNKFSSHLRRIYGDITFEEAFLKTGRILNIPVASVHSKEIPKLLNYVTAPNVLIWSAVTASCALPAVFKSVYLMAKDKQGNIINWSKTSQKFRDGSIGADVPMKRLSELFNVNHFIVSQVNPHVAPFLTHTQPGSAGIISSFFKFIKLELKYRTNQLAEFNLIPGFLSTFEPVITQTYHGDITIIPPFNWRNYYYLFSTPTKEFVQSCIDVAEKVTWPKVGVLESHLSIELTLDKAYKQLYTFTKLHGFHHTPSEIPMESV